MATRFKLNSRGVDALLKGGAADSACRPKAETVLARAKASAPVDSGAYRASLHIEKTTAAALGISFRTGSNDRTAYVVVSNVAHALAVEADTGNLARSL